MTNKCCNFLLSLVFVFLFAIMFLFCTKIDLEKNIPIDFQLISTENDCMYMYENCNSSLTLNKTT